MASQSIQTKILDQVSLLMDSIYQKHNWDCGIACAQMALSLVSPKLKEADFDEIMERLGIHHSVWTIDLAQMMHHLGVKVLFTTITLGVDPTYKDVDFYANQINIGGEPFTDEEKRVNDVFARAQDIGLTVEKRSVHSDEIIQHLTYGNPVIVLIDASILRCLNCEEHRTSKMCCTSDRNETKYQGHFIVLSGYSLSKQQFLYKNPTYYKGVCMDCSCTFTNLDEARHSHGTDEDILFIYR